MRRILLLFIFLFSLLEANEICDFNSEIKNDICMELAYKNVNIKYIKDYLNDKKSKDINELENLKYENKNNHILNEKSIETNLELLKNHLFEYKSIYNNLEKKYNINREVISSILLYETNLGKIKLKYSNKDFNSYLNYDEKNIKDYKKYIKIIKNSIIFCYFNKISIEKCDFKTSRNGDFGIAQFSSDNLKYVIPINNNYDLNNMEVSINSLSNLIVNVLKIEKINYDNFNNIDEFKVYVLKKYGKKQKYIISALINSYYINKNKIT